MPFSSGVFDNKITKYIKSIDGVGNMTMLDVGPGAGKYSTLLRKVVKQIDAVEIFEQYITKYDLENKYDNITVSNILDFEFEFYDIIIMGDILEHIVTKDAQALIERLITKCKYLIIIVPYNYKQEACYGNEHEKHEQDDLTAEIMTSRYATLKKIFTNEEIGVYVNL